METRSRYRTRQRDELLQYLKDRQGSHITVGDVCSHFACLGHPIGTATVYRQLESMVDEGLVNKYIIDAGAPACFEYLGENSHVSETCFHCRCERCGVLIHLCCDELLGFQSHMLKEHGFAIDPLRTVFYGLCETCRREAAQSGSAEASLS
ncbi:MAG: transcriptional repressor [Lachnospiraceae bacterium]|nr:transcriptional repressor [Lachnospiraceae bacterium]